MKKYLLILYFLLVSLVANAQLELCQGTQGNVVFYENFGNGVGIESPLPNGTITYSYTENFPEPGQYTIRSNTLPNLDVLPDPNDWQWHLMNNDWSNSLVSAPGKMLLVNANHLRGTLYKKTIIDLCGETSYAFSFWAAPLYNIGTGICAENNGLGIPINLKIEVWDETETQLLRQAETGNVNNTSTVTFKQYGLIFNTLPGQTSVVIKVINNNILPGCGNDIAIDEMLMSVCGGDSNVSTLEYGAQEPSFCENEVPVSLTLKIENSNTGNYFILQKSENQSAWEDVGVPILSVGEDFVHHVPVNITTPTRYRLKFASRIENLNNVVSCVWYSNIYTINIILTSEAPVTFPGANNIVYCGDSVVPTVAAQPVLGRTINWYDSPVGGNLLHIHSYSYTPPGPGTFYAQYVSLENDCEFTARTPFTISWFPGLTATTNPPPYFLCEGESVVLDAEHPNLTYEWEPSSLGTGQTATVTEPGLYVVTLRDPQSPCHEARTRTFIVTVRDIPKIANISNQGNTLTVTTEEEGEFEYSIDGVFWQSSNVFANLPIGLVIVYVRDLWGCGMDMQEHLILAPPLFFTPNDDGVNDTFYVGGTSRIDLTTYIFDRYGKLLTVLNKRNPYWDGTYKGKKMPSNDYWYKIEWDGRVVRRGHVTLKR